MSRERAHDLDFLVVGAATLLLFVYLVHALLRAEDIE
ncbi:potassium-transporting ATPase subunit F [Paraburkholderia tropica]|nr:potassium-transporting ATPase subunit F [Paraburkholderia tropica]